MKTSKNGINLIKNFEGCRLEAYLCPAMVWTIGYGHTENVKRGDKITEVQAETLLIIDLQKFENAVNNAVRVPLNQNQFDALVSFTFNIGIGNFKSSTLLKKLNASEYGLAACEFGRWNKSRGRILDGLTKRRRAEKELFLRPTFCQSLKDYLN